jgi:hypothetical protein
VEALLSEYRSIVSENDQGLNGTREGEQKLTYTDDEKRKWWKQRRTLDSRMATLFAQIEASCLGCWKGLLLGQLKGDLHADSLEAAERLTRVRAHAPTFAWAHTRRYLKHIAYPHAVQEIEEQSGHSVDEALVHACLSASPSLSDQDLRGCLEHLLFASGQPSAELSQTVPSRRPLYQWRVAP